MKRKLFVIGCLLLLLTACQPVNDAADENAVKPSETISEEPKSSAEIRMLEDLVGYIDNCEKMYADIQWVLDYFERFDEKKSWGNLQMARASLPIARMEIEECRLTDRQMTLEDQLELMKRGVDVSFMENLEKEFYAEQTATLNTCANLHYDIMNEVFLMDDWKICMQYVDLQKKLTASYIQYLAKTADWVLASLDDNEVTDKCYRVMKEHCPKTYACQAAGIDSPEDIQKATGLLLDEINDLLLEIEKVIGAKNNQLMRITEILEEEDHAVLSENLTEISDMPVPFFYPAWFNDEEVVYYWKQDEKVMIPEPGDEIESIPNRCQIDMENISKKEVLDYEKDLEKVGFASTESLDEDGKLSILYDFEDGSLALFWESGKVTFMIIDNPICFVPGWYLGAVFKP